MPALTALTKTDPTARTNSGTAAAEVTQYTVSWADLTTQGFANGDDVIAICFARLTTTGINAYVRFQIGKGSTYAGRTDFGDSYNSWEALTLSGNMQYGWMDRFTLNTNDNLYFSLWGNVAEVHQADDFFVFIFKTADLSADDFIYAEHTASGNAPSTNTVGANTTFPVDGEWALFGYARWFIDDTSSYCQSVIEIPSSEGMVSVAMIGHDTENEICQGLLGYAAGAAGAAGVTAEILYWQSASGTQDLIASKICGLRLGAFKDAWGVRNESTTSTQTALDTHLELAGNPTMVHSQTGPVIAAMSYRYPITESSKRAYGRIQLDGADWPATLSGRAAVGDNGANATLAPIFIGGASVTAGTRDWDFDWAEDADITPNPSTNRWVAFVFSLELAPTNEVYTYAGSGGLTSGGTAERARTKAATGTGGLTSGGAAVTYQPITYAYTASGGLTTGGAATTLKLRAYTYIASGGLTSGGTAGKSQTQAYAGTGGLTSGGAAPHAQTQAWTGSGGLTAGGIAPHARTKVYTATGGLVAGGSAPTEYAPPGAAVYPYTGTGGLTSGGAASTVNIRIRIYAGTGGLTLGGAALTAHGETFTYVGSGGLTLAGAAPHAQTQVYVATGGLTLGGTAGRSQTQAWSAAGGLVLGGTAPTSKSTVRVYVGTGGLTSAGAAPHARTRATVATGGLTTGGAAVTLRHKAGGTTSGTGGLTFGYGAGTDGPRLAVPLGGLLGGKVQAPGWWPGWFSPWSWLFARAFLWTADAWPTSLQLGGQARCVFRPMPAVVEGQPLRRSIGVRVPGITIAPPTPVHRVVGRVVARRRGRGGLRLGRTPTPVARTYAAPVRAVRATLHGAAPTQARWVYTAPVLRSYQTLRGRAHTECLWLEKAQEEDRELLWRVLV